MSFNFGEVDDFNFRDGTNGGANRFWYDENRDKLMVAVSDVSGREAYDDINDFINRAVELYDGVAISGQKSVDYDKSGELAYGLQSDTVVKFGPGNHNGSTTKEFDSNQDALNFLEFMQVIEANGFV